MSRQSRSPFTIARNSGENLYYCFLPRNERNPVRNVDYPFLVSTVDDIETDYTGAVIAGFGIIAVYLEHRIRVDLSLNKVIRLINPESSCSAVIDSKGQSVGLMHNSGRVLQCEGEVTIQRPEGTRAKVCSRGITFTARDSPVVYLLDEGGVRTTTDNFVYLDSNLTVNVFYNDAHVGKNIVGDCFDIMQRAQHFTYNNGDVTWVINGIKITQNNRGEVQVSRDIGSHFLKTSITSGTIIAQTPCFYACASQPPEGHIFARQGDKRIFANEKEFSVRYGPRTAGLDNQERIVLH